MPRFANIPFRVAPRAAAQLLGGRPSLAGRLTRSPIDSGMFRVDMQFFFDRQRVMHAITRSQRSALARAGAMIMRIARSSLKVGRQMRWDEIQEANVGRLAYDARTQQNVNYRYLTTAQHVADLRDRRARFQKWKRIGRRLSRRRGPLTPSEQRTLQFSRRLRRVRRPRVASAPGQPPKLKWANSPLKKLLLFSFDPQSRSVVVGPKLFRSKTQVGDADTLEFGGRSRQSGYFIAPRPYMRPAEEKARSRYPQLFRDFVR